MLSTLLKSRFQESSEDWTEVTVVAPQPPPPLSPSPPPPPPSSPPPPPRPTEAPTEAPHAHLTIDDVHPHFHSHQVGFVREVVSVCAAPLGGHRSEYTVCGSTSS
jgi:hypothetical protein